jgi:hypothetical protein
MTQCAIVYNYRNFEEDGACMFRNLNIEAKKDIHKRLELFANTHGVMYQNTCIFSSHHVTVYLPSALFFLSLERISWEEKVHYGLSQLMLIQGISWKDTKSGRLLSAFDSRVIWALLAPDLC